MGYWWVLSYPELPQEDIMTPEQLYKNALEAKDQNSVCGMSLAFAKGQKRPKGFPRGELLCETERGRVYSFDPDKIISWLKKHDLIAIT